MSDIVKEMRNLKTGLFTALGYEKLNKITAEVTKIVTANNLNVTPAVLEDVFRYLLLHIRLENL